MPGHIDDVVDAAGDPIVAVHVPAAAVTGEIHALEGRKVGLHEALVIAEHGAHLPRPTVEDHEVARSRAVQDRALVVDQRRPDTEERSRRRPWLELGGAGQWRDENATGFGLPPGIDDGAATVANHAVVPLPGFRIDGLTHAAEQLEGRAVRAFDEVVAR